MFNKLIKYHHDHTNASLSMINCVFRRFGRRYRRWYHWPNDFLPFHWERKKLEPPYLRTGDIVNDIGRWNPEDLIPEAKYSRLLNSDDIPLIVRKQFTLEFAERPTIVKHQMEKIIEMVRRYPYDTMSPEVKIAEYTVKIRNNLYYFNKINKYDAPRKIWQETLKNRRLNLLIHLYYQNRQSYLEIIKILGIQPSIPKLGEITGKVTRKNEIRRLTNEYCEQIKLKKLEIYHQELKQKQLELINDDDKNEKIIENNKDIPIDNN